MNVKLYDFNTTIARSQGVIMWRPPKGEHAQEIVKNALYVYSAQLDPGQHMYSDLADSIALHYDVNVPQTAETIRILRSV